LEVTHDQFLEIERNTWGQASSEIASQHQILVWLSKGENQFTPNQ
jgi:hypothetical protein